jgi:phosphoglycolate phosphatase
MSLSAILFDKDGTFVDFQRTWGPAAYDVMHALSAGDARVLAELADAMHYVAEEKRFLPTSPFIAGSNHDIAGLWAAILGREDVPALAREVGQHLRRASLDAIVPIGQPLEVFAALAARGLKLGIATNDSEESARAQAHALELLVHIDFIAGYDSGYGGKPGPGMIYAFADQLDIQPAEIAVVGDSTHDLEAARAAGAVAVAVLSGPADRAVLAPHADHVLDAIDALPALVDRLNAHGPEAAPRLP